MDDVLNDKLNALLRHYVGLGIGVEEWAVNAAQKAGLIVSAKEAVALAEHLERDKNLTWVQIYTSPLRQWAEGIPPQPELAKRKFKSNFTGKRFLDAGGYMNIPLDGPEQDHRKFDAMLTAYVKLGIGKPAFATELAKSNNLPFGPEEALTIAKKLEEDGNLTWHQLTRVKKVITKDGERDEERSKLTERTYFSANYKGKHFLADGGYASPQSTVFMSQEQAQARQDTFVEGDSSFRPVLIMRETISQAAKCESEPGKLSPKVAAAIIHEKHLTTAYRGQHGHGNHAEYTLFEQSLNGADVSGGTLYTTLEPCTSRNKHKPCADWIIEKGIERVIIGMLDPNPRIYGVGRKRLIDAGIRVEYYPVDLRRELEELNRAFIDQFRAKPELQGEVFFNPLNNNGRYTIGHGDFLFELDFTIGIDVRFGIHVSCRSSSRRKTWYSKLYST